LTALISVVIMMATAIVAAFLLSNQELRFP
jgi:hypothetical protein